MTTNRKLTAHEERALAVEALVDPRTIRKALNGDRVNPMARTRIVAALASRGLGHLLVDGNVSAAEAVSERR